MSASQQKHAVGIAQQNLVHTSAIDCQLERPQLFDFDAYPRTRAQPLGFHQAAQQHDLARSERIKAMLRARVRKPRQCVERMTHHQRAGAATDHGSSMVVLSLVEFVAGDFC